MSLESGPFVPSATSPTLEKLLPIVDQLSGEERTALLERLMRSPGLSPDRYSRLLEVHRMEQAELGDMLKAIALRVASTRK